MSPQLNFNVHCHSKLASFFLPPKPFQKNIINIVLLENGHNRSVLLPKIDIILVLTAFFIKNCLSMCLTKGIQMNKNMQKKEEHSYRVDTLAVNLNFGLFILIHIFQWYVIENQTIFVTWGHSGIPLWPYSTYGWHDAIGIVANKATVNIYMYA